MDNKRVELFDIIKGIMILFIIITHFHWVYPDDYLRYGFVFYIDMAVPVFMILTGYFYALSNSRRKVDTITEAYEVKTIINKILRFLIPFSIAFIIELPFLVLYKKEGLISLIVRFLQGGEGPGAYYTPIMIQTIFLLPILYFVIRKYDFIGFVFLFIVNGIYEAFTYYIGLGDLLYKYLVFRYIGVLASGIFIAIGKKRMKGIWLMIFFALGLTWQIALNYIPLKPTFMNFAWARVNYLSSIPPMVFIYLIINTELYNKMRNFRVPFIALLGKASFNIFLTQMVIYGCGLSRVIYITISYKSLQLLSLLFICVVFGLAFYKFENKISKKIIDGMSFLR